MKGFSIKNNFKIKIILKTLIVLSSINILFYSTNFNISDLFNKLNAVEGDERIAMLTHSSFPPIAIFSGSKIKLNDSKIYIFESYSATDSILYCRKFHAHRGITVLGELNKKNTNLIAFKNNEIKSISIELDKYIMSIGEEMGYQMTYGNIPLAGISASLGGYFGAWKGAIISMIPMILFAELEEFSPILASAGCLGGTAFTLAEVAFHAEHGREKFNTEFLKIPLSGENSWEIISQFDLENY